MNKHIIPILVILLLLSSGFVGVSNTAEEQRVDTEEIGREELLDDLAFYCLDASGSNAKYEYYKEKLFKDYPNDDIESVGEDTIQPVEPSPSTIQLGGPKDTPWSMQSHDTHHTGRSPYSTANVTGLEKWRFYSGDWFEDTPIIDSDGTIYAGVGWKLYAINPDGSLKWLYKPDGLILGSSPSIADDGTIYVGSWDYGGCLYAINPNGTRKWRFSTGANIASSPAIADDGTIYFGTLWSLGDGGKIHAVNPNGTEKWQYQTGEAVTSDPAIGDDGTIYIGSYDYYLYAMNPNGTLKWRFKTGDWIQGHPSIADDGTIYVPSFDGYLYAIYPNGTLKWKTGIGPGGDSSASIAQDGTLFIGSNKLYAIYPNGTKKWSVYLGGDMFDSSPAISADGTIYIGLQIGNMAGGEIIAVNPNGTEKWRKRIANDWVDSSPSIAEDGTVYIGSAYEMSRGYLHAFGPVESNSPPGTPSISGTTYGEVKQNYWYTFIAHDPDNNPIQLFVDWGDGDSGWVDWFASNQTMWAEHEWTEQGTYNISAKVKDVMGEESDFGYYEVEIVKPKFAFLSGRIYDYELIWGYGVRFKADNLIVIRFVPPLFKRFTSGEQIYMKHQIGILTIKRAFGFFSIYSQYL